MKTLEQMSREEVQTKVSTFATLLAETVYLRQHPQAPTDEALAWGVGHRAHFWDQAIEMFALIVAAGEAEDKQEV